MRKLAPGGRVLFETVNPESVYAMRWFWMDLTHVRPVPTAYSSDGFLRAPEPTARLVSRSSAR